MKPLDFFNEIGIDVTKEIKKMKQEPWVNLNAITIQDCLDIYQFKGRVTILKNGKVLDIVHPENKLAQNYSPFDLQIQQNLKGEEEWN